MEILNTEFRVQLINAVKGADSDKCYKIIGQLDPKNEEIALSLTKRVDDLSELIDQKS